jgi:hypothetical protein
MKSGDLTTRIGIHRITTYASEAPTEIACARLHRARVLIYMHATNTRRLPASHKALSPAETG